MRTAKEIAFLILTALLGLCAAGWSVHWFGPKPTGELLRYGGLVVGGFILAAKWLYSAFSSVDQLSNFDEVTRRDYLSALQQMKRRFNLRLVFGLLVGVVAIVVGIYLAETENLKRTTQFVMAAVGGAALVAGLVMVGAQLLATSWAGEFLASTKEIARQDAARLARLANDSRNTPEILE